MPTEGQTATNPQTGAKVVFSGGGWVPVASGIAPNPIKLRQGNLQVSNLEQNLRQGDTQIRKSEAELPYVAPQAAASTARAQQQVQDRPFERGDKLRSDFTGDARFKEYNAVLPVLMSGLQSAPNPAGDSALIYAYAKVMDPGSVVRESEGDAAASTAGFWDAQAEKLKKNLGFDGARGLPPGAAENLRIEMNRKVAQLAKTYGVARADYQRKAERQGVNADDVVGGFPGQPFFEKYDQLRARNFDDRPAPPRPAQHQQISMGGTSPLEVNVTDTGGPTDPRADPDIVAQAAAEAAGARYNNSPLSQGLSGINEGIASTLGAPVDLANSALGLGAEGLNYLAGTDLQAADKPFLGSEWIGDRLSGLGAIGAESSRPGMGFIRRVGQSVGASALPIAGTATSLGRGLFGLGSAAAGGIGAATAQQVAPGNPYAELGGELVGSALGGGAGFLRGRRLAQREIESAVPTIPDLKAKATDLYGQAEANGITASPQQTQGLSQNIAAILADEGTISPTGRLSEVQPKIKEAYQLVNDYAGQPMKPKQMQTVRSVLGDASRSTEPNERRIAKSLLEEFDAWASPMAPELAEARKVSSRYLQAGDLEQARELAGARAGQFSGSGFENALRTEYRGLDRGVIKNRESFHPDVVQALQKVSRGTPVSNVARGFGKLAPTGVVSAGLTTGVPFAIGNSLGGPAVGAGAAGLTTALGIGGRQIATQMGIRGADIAELLARNGGALPEAQVITPDIQKLIAAGLLGQQSQYLDGS